jgi:hypothetical protein
MADHADVEQKLQEIREDARQAIQATLAPPRRQAPGPDTPEQHLAQLQQEQHQLRAQISRLYMDMGTLAEIVSELRK